MVNENQGTVEKEIEQIKSALSEVKNDVRVCSREQNGLNRRAEELRVELDTHVQARALP
jgi:hypothetical protein